MNFTTPEQIVYDRQQAWLRDMNECDSTCEPLGMRPVNRGNSLSSMTDWLIENLPSLPYALERTMNYIFSNGLTTGNVEQEEVLSRWLYEQKNRNGATNYAVLREAIWLAHAYGEAGLRWYDGNIYAYKQGYFGLIVEEDNGIEEIVAYYMRNDREKVTADIKDDEWGQWSEWYDAVDYFDRKGLMLLDKSEFVTIRNDTSKLHGTPSLLLDKQRVKLLLSAYERLNYDIDYDGPGRTFFWEAAGYTSDENGVSTTTELLNNSQGSKAEREKKAKEEIRGLAKEIKTSGSDAIGVLSKAIDREHVLQLPRVTKATEFFGWVEGEGEIIAHLLGMSPVLLEAGEWSGNVSMEALIDSAMLNTIIPIREKYAIQFSEFIAGKLNVDKVYFNKYDMQQVRDDNDEREKVSMTIQRLANAYAKEPSEVVKATMDNLALMIDNSIHDDNGDLRSL